MIKFNLINNADKINSFISALPYLKFVYLRPDMFPITCMIRSCEVHLLIRKL